MTGNSLQLISRQEILWQTYTDALELDLERLKDPCHHQKKA
jgi:hypothetical protein